MGTFLAVLMKVGLAGCDDDVTGLEASTVTVTFDEGTSVQNMTITGDGEAIMNPVITAGGQSAGSL